MITYMNLCFLLTQREILLGEMQRGPFAGHLNGHGGKLEDKRHGELTRYLSLLGADDLLGAERVMRESAISEVREESGLQIRSPELIEKLGVMHFSFTDKPERLEVHWYRSSHFSGELTDTKEMKNAWYRISAIPFNRMMPVDKELLPHVIDGEHFIGSCLYTRNGKQYSVAKGPRISLVSLDEVLQHNSYRH